MAIRGWSGETEALKHESAFPIALIGVNIWYLKSLLQCLNSLKWPSSPCQPLPSSSLIWKTLSWTKRWLHFSLVCFQIGDAEGERKERGAADCVMCSASESIYSATEGHWSQKALVWIKAAMKNNFRAPTTGESHFFFFFFGLLLRYLTYVQYCPIARFIFFSAVPLASTKLSQPNQPWHGHCPATMSHCPLLLYL